MEKLSDKIRKIRLVRALVYAVVGIVSYPFLAVVNRLKITGTENLENLPSRNVLFVSNHQTYFADVITFLHIFCAVKWGRKNKLGFPIYLLKPFTNVFYVAAEETMKKSWVSRLFLLAGGITVKRTWRKEGEDVRRNLDPSDTRKIDRALKTSWVITFPQGTTKPYAPGRKGTAYIIKNNEPIVIPVVIGGFWRAFNKTGLKLKRKGSHLTVSFGEPLQIDYESDSLDTILEKVMDSIRQSRKYMLSGGHHKTPVDKTGITG